ncbi:hypothetical protein [Deinococcus kurensis]|uniref:hypothetical protein n=1 Tax=Deinococcus kurensis TaxID=2662757 RepID=UPI0012D2D21A|nr:hypothetical protein [Deinococcus kurensis]
MFKQIKYLGSQAGDSFTYRAGTFQLVFERGKAYRVPEQFAESLLTDPAFTEVKATKKETE